MLNLDHLNNSIQEVLLTIYKRILSKKQQLDKQIQSLKTQIDALPEGKFVCTRNKTRYKWYQSLGNKLIYIPKSNRALAEKLALKKYLSLVLDEILQEEKALDAYLRHHPHGSGQAEQLLIEMPEYQDLLSSYLSPPSQELLDWMKSPYEHNPKYPEQLIYRTNSPYFVRSKSESLIFSALQTHKIPFRYECALTLGEITFYPDFTILHPKTGETFYWEHFGKMDDSGYRRNSCSKLDLFISHGIIPGIQLITTYETKQHPLDMGQIDAIIEQYFL